MKLNKLLSLFLLFTVLFTFNLQSQNLSAKILDSTNRSPVPYATVLLNKKGVITNEDGQFNFPLDEKIQPTDTLFISCIGYESLAKPISEFTETVIYLSAKAIELREVIVSNKNYSADEIMDLVDDNLEKNYTNSLTKKRFFHRESRFDRWTKSNFFVKKSSIDILNQQFLDSVIETIPKNNSYYSEIVGDLYGDYSVETQKLDLLKASKLFDKSKELDFEKLEEKFNEILRNNTKSGSYFKIKSGLFGTKIDADEVDQLFGEPVDSTDVAAVNKQLEEKKKNKEQEQKNYANWKRNHLGEILNSLPMQPKSDFNFITKSRKYEFTLNEFTYLGNDAVYVIAFKPSGSADYEGMLYVNADDFALLQIDFTNVKPVEKFNLLGVSSNKYLSKGKIIFSKGSNGFYGLRYFESETGSRIGLKRPLKIIEKNKIVKGRNKQNELSGDMDFVFINIEKNELIVFESENIDQATFDRFTENNAVSPTYMPKYDPEFWEGYTIMAPNTAIQEFNSSALE